MIHLELDVNEVNTILRLLGKHPFDEVVNLIIKIKQQGDSQAEALAQQEQPPAA